MAYLIGIVIPLPAALFFGFAIEYSYKANFFAKGREAAAYMDAFVPSLIYYALITVMGWIIIYFRRSFYPAYCVLSFLVPAVITIYTFFRMRN